MEMKDYLITEQVAKELGCTINRVYYLKNKGLLKPIKIMDRYLYSVEDVERFKNQENAGNKESA